MSSPILSFGDAESVIHKFVRQKCEFYNYQPTDVHVTRPDNSPTMTVILTCIRVDHDIEGVYSDKLMFLEHEYTQEINTCLREIGSALKCIHV